MLDIDLTGISLWPVSLAKLAMPRLSKKPLGTVGDSLCHASMLMTSECGSAVSADGFDTALSSRPHPATHTDDNVKPLSVRVRPLRYITIVSVSYSIHSQKIRCAACSDARINVLLRSSLQYHTAATSVSLAADLRLLQ